MDNSVGSVVITATGQAIGSPCRVLSVFHNVSTSPQTIDLYDGFDAVAGTLKASLAAGPSGYGGVDMHGLLFERAVYVSTAISSGKITIIYQAIGKE